MGQSLYLAAQPELLYGVARLLDLGNTFDLYNNCSTGDQADLIGILSDWEIVGQDLWASVYDYEGETNLSNRIHGEQTPIVGR